MTAAAHPTPPVPAAEGDAVERAARAAREVYHSRGPGDLWQAAARAALAAAGVPAMRAEVEWLRGGAAMIAAATPCSCSAQRARAVSAEQERDALRERVEALASSWDQESGDLVPPLPSDAPWTLARDHIDQLRALLAEPGGQAGEATLVEVRGRGHGKTQATAERVADAVKRRGLSAEILPIPAPAVPDSAGVPKPLPAENYGEFGLGWNAALRAVVGPGVTAEQAWDEAEHTRRQRIDDTPCPKCGGDRLRQDFTGSGRCHAPRPAPSTTTEGENR